MRIAILMPGWGWWGTNIVATSQAAIFAKVGHQVALFALGNGHLFRMNLGMRAEFLRHLPGLPPWGWPWRLTFNMLPPPLHLPFIYRSVRPLSGFEVVIVYDEPTIWLGYYAKKLYRLKFIHFAEASRFPQSSEPIYRKVYLHLVDYWMRKAYKYIDLVATESETGREALKQRFGIESIITGGITDLSLFNPSASGKEVRDSYCLGNAPLILYVDHLEPYKGVETLMDAFDLVLDSMPNAKLMVIGKCQSRSYCERIQRRSNKSVIFIEYVPHSELPKFYAASTIFATCAMWEEGYNHTVVEAQACGKPVVAFRLDPHEEVIKDGETGILVNHIGNAQEFASAMLTLLTDPSLTDAMGRKAVDWASYLSNMGVCNVQKLIDKIKSLQILS